MIKGDSTPIVFCAELMEVSEEIENIVCTVQYKDGTTHTFSNAMSNGDVAWLRWCFDQNFRPEYKEDG